MERKKYESFFRGKKITVMGLGVLGRGLQVTKFLAECGASVTVTDLKNREALWSSIKALKKYKIRFVLGRHDFKDFEKVDLIIKAAGVPLDSLYIKHAHTKGVPIAMDASLFAKLVENIKPKVTVIGITGTRGKSMTTAVIYHILKANKKALGGDVYLGGNMREKATLPLIKKVNPKDFVVLELDSWQLQGFGDEKISPHISVFTNLMSDHMNYYKGNPKKYLSDKENIYKFQTSKDFLITNKNLLKTLTTKPKGKVLLPSTSKVASVSMNILGNHNIQNASYAYETARILGLKNEEICRALETFPGLEGRLEYLGKKSGVEIINDNNATTPEATIAGIEAVYGKHKNIILICGGSDKELDLSRLVQTIKKFCHKTILLKGTGTEHLKNKLNSNFKEVASLKDALKEAFKVSEKNDVILFSPGFASFGMFKNEYERNDQFLKLISARK
ncbi:MAG: UDP-N-acetylmuramoyl-L-alanine--D-glutamate ligase [Patescibacteria group bacterium]